jgi:hypothetical protein
VDQGYQPSPRDQVNLQLAVRRLKERKLARNMWERYLQHVFKRAVATMEGRYIYALCSQVAMRGWIDSFVATLGERPYSLDDADDVLIAGGFDLPGHKVISALDWAVKLKYGRTVPPRLEAENPEEWAQIQYLAAHLDEVGFDDDPEGGND